MADLGTTKILGDLTVTGALIAEGLLSEHIHNNATTSISGFMSASDKTKLNTIATNANNYTHPSGDGNLHMPVTGTGNSGKYLRAGSTAGSVTWSAVLWGDIASKPSTFTPSAHKHSVSDLTGVAAVVHTHDYLTGTYISGGAELPIYFGSSKMKLQMLQGPTGWGWSDTLWLSSYGGGDVKGSNQIVISKSLNKIGFRRQDFDAKAWGAINEIYHTGFKPTATDVGALPITGGTLTGALRLPAASFGAGDAFIYVGDSDKNLCFRGGSAADGYIYTVMKPSGVYINGEKIVTENAIGSSHNHDTLRINDINTIKLYSHGNNTWLRNDAGRWTFQSGSLSDDWTKTFQINLPPITTQTDNSEWAYIGQGQTNGTNGKYRGVSIIKIENSAITGGDLSIGRLYGYGNKLAIETGDSWLRLNTQNSFKDGVFFGTSIVRTDGEFQNFKNGVTWTVSSENTHYTHYRTTAPSHWFNTTVRVAGDIYAGSNYDQLVYHKGNLSPMKLYLSYGSVDISNANLGEAYVTECTGNASAPDTDWWHILYMPHSNSNGFGGQIALSLNNNAKPMYVRSAEGTTWGKWRAVGTADNNNYCRTFSRVYNAVWNDYAEYFEKEDLDEEIEAGDIVVVSENEERYTKATKVYDTNTVGVVSDSYGHIVGGTGDETKDEKECVAVGLSGRVNVKIKGLIKKGDFIVASGIPGVGMKSENYVPGSVVGKALESKKTDTIDKVKMLIINC